MTWRFVFGACLLTLCGVPFLAGAHATPTSYEPKAGASLPTPPSTIEIFFSERIEPSASGIKAYAEDGSEVGVGTAVLDAADPRHFSLALEDTGDGVYTIAWQVVSVDDGHFTSGSYSFLVSAEGKTFEGSAESVQVLYVTKISEAFLHFVTLIGESILIAVLLVFAFVIRPYFKDGTDVRTLDTKRLVETSVMKVLLFGGALFIASILAVFIKKSLELSGVRSESLFQGIILLGGSVSGIGMLLKAALGGFFVALWYYSRKKIFIARSVTAIECILFLLLVGIIYLQSEISHAAASFFYPKLSVAITAFHLFFKELLVGGSLVLLVFLTALATRGMGSGSGKALARFGMLSGFAILMGGLSGIYITWLHLKRFENLFATEWGERFALLAAFGGAFFLCRVLSQFVVAPCVLRHERLMRMILPVEVVLGLLVLFYSAYISITTPPFTVEQYSFAREVQLDAGTVVLEQHPYEGDELRIRFAGNDGMPLGMEKVTVTLSSPALGIDANVVPVSERAVGSYVVPKAAFAPSGAWDVAIIGQRSGAYDMRGQFTLHMPEDVSATRYSDEERAFDAFAEKMLSVSLLCALAAFIMMGHAWFMLTRQTGVSVDGIESGSFSLTAVGVVIGLVVVVVVFGACKVLLTTPLEEKCIAGGFEWRQAYPARDMAPTSPNSLLGCYMHGGHYHLVDEAEFDHILPNLTPRP